jgi:multicomponent Na+:H+ antiporter subunit E
MKVLISHITLTLVFIYIVFTVLILLPFNATTVSLAFITFFLFLWPTSYLYSKSYFTKLPKVIKFIFFFLKKIFLANIKIAYDILTPGFRMNPTVVAFPLTVKTDLEITWLSCIVTLTPGSLSLDVSEDKQILYIHALYLKNNESANFKAELRDGFERRILELTK